jgi:CheY-like chemotaxis protein
MLPRTIGPQIAIEEVVDRDVWQAVTTPASLELAVLNLAINARDAMPSGGALTIASKNLARGKVRLPPDLDPGDYVMISVSDNGSGMSEQVRSQAFEPFFTTKQPGKGTGLGLSMVYAFAKQTGGTVTIESEIGKGTVVRIYLPRATDCIPPPGERHGQEEVGAGSPSRVLVVDDDDGVRTTISALVKEFGHEVIEAASGREALELLQRDRQFDLLIVDFAMPLMHGAELAKEARWLLPRVPVLFVTGDSDAAEIGETSQDPVLKKPFRQTDLAERLRNLLSDKAQGPTAGATRLASVAPC